MTAKELTKEIQAVLCKHLVGTLEHKAVCENFDYLYEMDVASLTLSGLLHEFEVKVSRADFLADKKKGIRRGGINKFEQYETNSFKRPNYFNYVCPEGLITANEIPAFAGLAEIFGLHIDDLQK